MSIGAIVALVLGFVAIAYTYLGKLKSERFRTEALKRDAKIRQDRANIRKLTKEIENNRGEYEKDRKAFYDRYGNLLDDDGDKGPGAS